MRDHCKPDRAKDAATFALNRGEGANEFWFSLSSAGPLPIGPHGFRQATGQDLTDIKSTLKLL